MNRLNLVTLLLATSISLVHLPDAISAQQNNNPQSTPENKPESQQAVAARVDDFLTAAGVTGGILIAKNGEVILRKGYSWADDDRKIPMTTNTVFDIGSVTKQFTGAAILKLEEQGKLRVTDSIAKFFKDVPADKQNITVHQLLTHTSGFEHDVVERTEFPTRDEAVRRMLNSRLKLKPGEKYSYSNAGYALLAAIVEIASGMPYEHYLHKHLWKPAGMLKTGDLIPQWGKADLARGYDLSGDVGISQEKWWGEDGPSWGVRGAGYVLSTLEDLYLWHLALEGEKILSKESKRKLFAPHVPEDDKGSSHYGYGWAIFKTPRGTRNVGHDGSNGIYYTNFHRYVDEGVVIIYFTNERNTGSRRILGSVPKLFFGGDFPSFPRPKTTLSRSALQKYAGLYELPSGERFALDVVNNHLTVKAVSLGVGKLLTTFPKLEDSERLHDLQPMTARLIEALAREEFEPIRELIYFEGTFEEEKAYWKRTFAGWTKRFGAFKKSEVVGTVSEKEFLDTYVLLQFERGTTIVVYRQNEKKQFFIGTSTTLLPRHYRLIPQSNTEFVVYNHALQTSTPVNFSFGEKNAVTGLTIRAEDEKVYARKITP
jgi:CubicO group peptidase (beta-lactamase class C family)